MHSTLACDRMKAASQDEQMLVEKCFGTPVSEEEREKDVVVGPVGGGKGAGRALVSDPPAGWFETEMDDSKWDLMYMARS